MKRRKSVKLAAGFFSPLAVGIPCSEVVAAKKLGPMIGWI